MCTLIVAWRAWSGTPLFVAANRDESLIRPAAPPQVWENRPLGLLAPVDLEAGGTWWGVNGVGVFGAITNRAGRPPDRSRRSRGGLVVRALEWESAQQGLQSLVGLDPRAYNPFHLVLADQDGAFLLWSEGETLHHRRLGSGVHVFTEQSLGAADGGREQRVRDLIDRRWGTAPPSNDAAQGLLSERGDLLGGGPCIVIPGTGYGTRSATVLRLGATPGEGELLQADGPPCTTPFQDQSQTLRELLGRSPSS